MNRNVDCSILGVKYLPHNLSELGYTKIAYDVAIQETYPGWRYWIAQAKRKIQDI